MKAIWFLAVVMAVNQEVVLASTAASMAELDELS